jgi:hypothetical protein
VVRENGERAAHLHEEVGAWDACVRHRGHSQTTRAEQPQDGVDGEFPSRGLVFIEPHVRLYDDRHAAKPTEDGMQLFDHFGCVFVYMFGECQFLFDCLTHQKC